MGELQTKTRLANTVLMATQVSAGKPAGKPTGKPTAKVGVVREPGEHLDRYIILGQLGEGGMGIVYAAYDPKLDRKVALKVLSAGLVGTLRDEARERMVAEARAIARVNHVNVVAVHDVGTAGDEVFVGMELVDGC
ncbi:MAG: protein kinase domain-containing protein, partial [Nannocystaceae bacterium]